MSTKYVFNPFTGNFDTIDKAPRLTTAEITAMSSPEDGMLVYDTDTNTYKYYNNTSWVEFSSATPSSEGFAHSSLLMGA